MAFFLVSSKITLRPWCLRWSIHVTSLFSRWTIKLDWPNDTLVEALPAPALKAAIVFSSYFWISLNVDSSRCNAFPMVAVDSPLLYLLIMSTFFSRVIVFLVCLLQEERPFHFWSCFGGMMNYNSQTLRRTIERTHNNAQVHATTCLLATSGATRRRERRTWDTGDPSTTLLLFPFQVFPLPPLRHSISLTSRPTWECLLGWLVAVGMTRKRSFRIFCTFYILWRLTLWCVVKP